MGTASPTHVYCNGVRAGGRAKRRLVLDYLDTQRTPNVRLNLPRLVEGLLYLPDRLLDLLEIAAYVYTADRYVSRGRTDAVEFESWSRDFRFHVKVRDLDLTREVLSRRNATFCTDVIEPSRVEVMRSCSWPISVDSVGW